jgi:hypothetical protein
MISDFYYSYTLLEPKGMPSGKGNIITYVPQLSFLREKAINYEDLFIIL